MTRLQSPFVFVRRKKKERGGISDKKKIYVEKKVTHVPSAAFRQKKHFAGN
jgi:hypothetical protein